MSTDNFEAIGVSVHSLFASYFDELALKAPAYKLYRMDSNGGRYYYTLDKSLRPTFYPSLTHVIGKTLPMPEGLIKWKAELGVEAAEAYMNERGEYGTDMHVSFEELLRYREIDLDSLQTREEWKEDLKKDLLSFAAFIREHNVVPLAIEVMLKSEMGFACTVDLVCKMDVGTGQNGNITKTDLKNGTINTIHAIVDFKSGKKNFYESHEIQLAGCKAAWNESKLGVKIDRVFNWAPTDWKKEPTWKLKEQTDSRSAKKLPILLELFKVGEADRPSDILQMSGMLRVDGNISDAYSFIAIDDYIARRHEK